MKLKYLFLISVVFALASCGGETVSSSLEQSSSEEPSLEISSLEPEISSIEEKEECDEPFYHLDKRVDPTEESDGYIIEECAICGYKKETIIPKLSSLNYEVTNLTYNCVHGNGKRYSNEKYGVYEVTDDIRKEHSVYGDYCEECGELVGEFKFQNFSKVACGGYPRLYQLSDYWDNAWLLGGDNDSIIFRKSDDQGVTWTSEKRISFLPNHACANVDFFELPNHDIICSYRAIGKRGTGGLNLYNRKLHYSISYDGGESWEDGGDIVDNFELAISLGYSKNDAVNAVQQHGSVGFFEPYVDYINNVPTVMYADDFTSMLLKPKGPGVSVNYCTQYLMSQTFDMETMTWSTERKIIMDGTKEKSPTGSDLVARVSRDGMPVFSRMKDGTYVVVFEGTYRDSDYYQYSGGQKLDEYHPFEILMSYSYDGETWSNPVEIYTPHNKGSKASAPYVCVTDDNRLIVSFQTDEDAVLSGYVGDAVSVMKCMISKPGVKIEDITQDSFYAVNNVNKTPVGSGSLWNGMMLINNKLYTCSSSCKIRVSDIPVYADKVDYQEEEIKIEGNEYEVVLESDSFDTYTSSASINPVFSDNKLTLNHTSHAEEKLIIKNLEVEDVYQIDFTLETEATSDVNVGFYLGAINPGNDLDKITALNIHIERAPNTLSWSTHLYNFNQGYSGQLGDAGIATSETTTINVRVVVDHQNIKILIDDMAVVVGEYDVADTFDLTGVLGIRNQGLSKVTFSKIVITKA